MRPGIFFKDEKLIQKLVKLDKKCEDIETKLIECNFNVYRE